MHSTWIRTIVGACAVLALVSCAAQAPGQMTQSERGRTDEAQPYPPPPPPPPAPPPPPVVADGITAGALAAREQRYAAPHPSTAPYAQTAPQPMPGTIDRDRYEDVAPNPIHEVAEEPVSTFSVDVDTASYSNVRRFLSQGQLPPPDAVRIEELINYFDYDYPLPRTRARPFEPHVAIVSSPWAEGRGLLHIGLQGYDVVPTQRPPPNLVFLIDVSGSMSSPDKLPLLVQSFRMLTNQLTARDRVGIVVYAGAAGAVLEPTPGNDHARINAAFDQLRAGGSTAGGAGLALAYSLAEQNFNRNAINRVILATDGDFNVGTVDDASLEGFIARKRDSGIYLSVFGFGRGNYNDQLMQTLAQNGNGVAAYIDTLNEARRVLSEQMASTLFPIANDVKIQVEFNPSEVVEYRLIGYETRMLRREDFNNDRVDAGEIGSGHSVTALYEMVMTGGRTFNDPLRYQERASPPETTNGEIALLRIRYKLPGEDESRLIERVITRADIAPSITRAREQTRWAVAVAGYGQLLRGDPYLDRGYGWDDVIALAQTARGRDEFGWRAEFVQLARAAATAQAAAPPVVPSQPEPPRPTPRPRPGSN